MDLITKKEACNLIQITDGEAWTTSLVIAEQFGRSHKHVLRSLDSLINDGTLERGREIGPTFRDELQPNTTLLPGYHAGFEAGFAKARESVLAALEAA